MPWNGSLPETRESADLTPGAPLPALTGLRFIAAFGVFLCHFSKYLFPWGPPLLLNLTAGMFNLVGLFFILSGFILAHTYGERFSQGTVSAGRFFRARFARLYPTYLFSLALAFPGFFVTFGNHSWRTVGEYSLIKLPMLQSWVFWDPKYMHGWNGPSWTISTEIFFYLLFPLLVRWIMATGLRRCASLLVFVIGLSTIVAVGYDVGGLPASLKAEPWLFNLLFASPFSRITDFALGVLLYRVLTLWLGKGNRISPFWRRGLWLTLVSGLLVLWLSPLVMAKNQGLTAFLFVPVIALLALGRGTAARALGSRQLVMLGEESYAFYLLHIPVFDLFWRGYTRLLGESRANEKWGMILGGVLTLAIVLVLSRLVFRYLESPARRWILGGRARARDG